MKNLRGRIKSTTEFPWKLTDMWYNPFQRPIMATQAVLDTVHVTAFDQSYVVSARAMADTFFVANGRVGCRFLRDFCTHVENQTNLF